MLEVAVHEPSELFPGEEGFCGRVSVVPARCAETHQRMATRAARASGARA
ncbi:hypothetical protein [Amycolatopsis thailandensis]|nr:hypothetical protein [Amycolatopsis thailandensis]